MSAHDLQLVEFENACLWYIEEGDTVTVGITQKAIDSVGTINEIELAEVGDEYSEKDWIGEIFGNNNSFEILAPFSLRITEVNPEVLDQANFVEDDPTGDAWLLRGEKLGT